MEWEVRGGDRGGGGEGRERGGEGRGRGEKGREEERGGERGGKGRVEGRGSQGILDRNLHTFLYTSSAPSKSHTLLITGTPCRQAHVVMLQGMPLHTTPFGTCITQKGYVKDHPHGTACQCCLFLALYSALGGQ